MRGAGGRCGRKQIHVWLSALLPAVRGACRTTELSASDAILRDTPVWD